MGNQIRLAVLGMAVAIVTAVTGSSASAQSYVTACTQEYAPVCAARHGVARIYPSRCVARSQGAHVVSKSNCSRRPVSVRG